MLFCLSSSQMALVILVLRQIVNRDAKLSTTWLSACVQLDSNLVLTKYRVLTLMNVSTRMETASIYATTMLVLILVLAILATIWCLTVTLACPLIHVLWTTAAVTTSVHLQAPLKCAVVDLAMSLPLMEHRVKKSTHVLWTMVAVTTSVPLQVPLECAVVDLAMSLPLMEHHVKKSTHVLWTTVVVNTPVMCLVIPECVAADLAISFPPMAYHALTSLAMKARVDQNLWWPHHWWFISVWYLLLLAGTTWQCDCDIWLEGKDHSLCSQSIQERIFYKYYPITTNQTLYYCTCPSVNATVFNINFLYHLICRWIIFVNSFTIGVLFDWELIKILWLQLLYYYAHLTRWSIMARVFEVLNF